MVVPSVSKPYGRSKHASYKYRNSLSPSSDTCFCPRDPSRTSRTPTTGMHRFLHLDACLSTTTVQESVWHQPISHIIGATYLVVIIHYVAAICQASDDIGVSIDRLEITARQLAIHDIVEFGWHIHGPESTGIGKFVSSRSDRGWGHVMKCLRISPIANLTWCDGLYGGISFNLESC
jgi:hypothetical protein